MIRKDAAIRAYTPDPGRKAHRNVPWFRPRRILVFDSETWIDPAQAFRFGFFRYARLRWGRSGPPEISVVEESIVHADDLDPHDLETLHTYRRNRRADVDRSVLEAQYRIALYPRSEFERLIFSRTYRSTGTWVVGANLPFDLSRIVAPHQEISTTGWEAGPGYEVDRATNKRTRRREPGFYTNGFSLPVSEYQAEDGSWHERSRDEPRLGMKRLGPQRTAMGLIQPKFHGHFLDVLTLGAALSGEHLPLTAAEPRKGFCEVFGVDYPGWLERFGVSFTKREAPHGERLTPEYISYNRADVAATTELFGALMAEHRALRIKTQPTRIFSSASISKDTLRRLGVRPRLDAEPEFPEDVLGYSMVAFYGGRSECKIRRTPVPVTYLDVKSMYPAVSSLLGLQELLAAEHVVVRDSETAAGLLGATQSFLEGLTLDSALERDTWGGFRGIALVEPQGDLLPIRADWRTEALGIAQAFIEDSSEPAWWSLPDLAAARIRGRHAPTISRVILFEAEHPATTLKAISLAGKRLDLRRADLYTALVELRETKGTLDPRWDRFLKVVANSLYGITAEMNAERTVDGKETDVAAHALRSYSAPTKLPEKPGPFFFAPVAALTTAGARLMLAAIERLVTDAGGTWCFADTDSMAVVSSEHGGLVPCPGGPQSMPDGRDATTALSWLEVEELRARVNALNPYARSVVEDLLKLEKVNFVGNDTSGPRRELGAWAISAKRYMLFVPGNRAPKIVETVDTDEVQDVEPEEVAEHRLHGLGHLMNPHHPDSSDTSWTEEAWSYMFAIDQHPDDPPPEPRWFGAPALSKHTVSSPVLLRAFHAHNHGRPYAESIKPFNFLLVAHITDAERRRRGPEFRLGAPYSRKHRDWNRPVWRNVRAGGKKADLAYRITTHDPEPEDPSLVGVKSYRDVIREYLDHPEAKAVDASGSPCAEETKGLLLPPTVRIRRFLAIGKETNRLDDRTVGLVDTYEATNVYREPGDDFEARLLDAMNKLGVERLYVETVALAERSDGASEAMPMAKSTIRDITKGRSHGTAAHRQILRQAALRAMRRWLRGMGLTPERGGLEALVDQLLAAWQELVERPSERFDQRVASLRTATKGTLKDVATAAGVSRQHLPGLKDPERRARVVRILETRSVRVGRSRSGAK